MPQRKEKFAGYNRKKKYIILFHVEIIQLTASTSDQHHMLCMNYTSNTGDFAANSASPSQHAGSALPCLCLENETLKFLEGLGFF